MKFRNESELSIINEEDNLGLETTEKKRPKRNGKSGKKHLLSASRKVELNVDTNMNDQLSNDLKLE